MALGALQLEFIAFDNGVIISGNIGEVLLPASQLTRDRLLENYQV